jgi:hypothetical protein
MKKNKPTLSIAVAILNIYYFTLWIVAFNKFSNQTERVDFFLQHGCLFNSIGALNLTLVVISIISLIFVNLRPFKSKALRYTISSIHFLFLLFVLWSYL